MHTKLISVYPKGEVSKRLVTSEVVDRMKIDGKATVAACLLIQLLSDVDWDQGGSAYQFGNRFLQSYKERIPGTMHKI